MDNRDRKILDMVKGDTIAALGCTEPIAVAYAGASLNRYIDQPLLRMRIDVSLNIFKNGKSVYIPNTAGMGLDLAGVLGYLGGDMTRGLLVLDGLDQSILDQAEEILERGQVELNCLEDRSDIYLEIELETEDHLGKVILEGSHTGLKSIVLDGEEVYREESRSAGDDQSDILNHMSFIDIRELVERTPLDELDFLREGIEMNRRAGERGLEKKTGLGIGYSLNRMEARLNRELDPVSKVRIMTAAAADARMSGENCPVMTSGGSGNQGLGVFLPISIVAETEGVEEDRLLRAIYFGHIVNKYVKVYTGKLSSLCGCAIASCVGAAAANSWMLGGNDQQIAGACNTIFANLTGMICDGAKDTCSLKLATSAAESLIASYLSLEDVYPNKNIGIVGESIEETIENLGLLRTEGLAGTDRTIVGFI